MREVRENKAFN